MKKIHVSKSKITGVGLHASEPISRGDRVAYIHGPIRIVRDFTKLPIEQRKPSDNWIGVGRYSYIDTANSPFRFINHSCDPNTVINLPRTVTALKHITKNTEITMDYSLTEAGQDFSISKCTCGAKKCRGRIGPINSLSPHTFRAYLPYIQKKFQRVYYTLCKQ